MTKAVRLALLFGIAWAMQSGVSFAMEDWLDRLSGPGPFLGTYLSYRFVCFSNTEDQIDYGRLVDPMGRVLTEADPAYVITPLLLFRDRTATIQIHPQLPPSLARPTTQAEVESYRQKRAADDCKSDKRLRGYATLSVHAYKPFPNTFHNDLVQGVDGDVSIWGADIAYVERLNNGPIELSFLVGVDRFTGDAFDSFTKVVLNPSIVFAPFAIAQDSPRVRALKLSLGYSWFLGGFEARDFCQTGNDTSKCAPANLSWRSGPELVPRFGVVIDPALFFCNSWKFWQCPAS